MPKYQKKSPRSFFKFRKDEECHVNFISRRCVSRSCATCCIKSNDLCEYHGHTHWREKMELRSQEYKGISTKVLFQEIYKSILFPKEMIQLIQEYTFQRIYCVNCTSRLRSYQQELDYLCVTCQVPMCLQCIRNKSLPPTCQTCRDKQWCSIL